MNTDESLTCPRCLKSLGHTALSGVPLAVCSGCQGVLVEQRVLMQLMEEMAGEMMEGVDPEHELAPTPDDGLAQACPRCGGPLVTFGYMGMSLVYPSRCGACQVLWADPGELSAMALLYARTERRVQATREREARAYRAVDESVQAIMKQRFIDRLLGELL